MENEWRKIESAPKDGARIILGGWHPDIDEGGNLVGTFHWCAEIGYWKSYDPPLLTRIYGIFNKRVISRAKEIHGYWPSGGGWFESDEVSHWLPLPDPPRAE